MNWDDLSESARKVMRELGNFSPTFHQSEKLVKGYTLDDEGDPGKRYYSSAYLRQIAEACVEVADWLDSRAAQHNNPTGH